MTYKVLVGQFAGAQEYRLVEAESMAEAERKANGIVVSIVRPGPLPAD